VPFRLSSYNLILSSFLINSLLTIKIIRKMAKFELQNASIKKIERGQNKGKEYVAGTLINVQAPWDAARSFTEFDENKINIVKQYIPASKGGTGAESAVLPDVFRFINGHYVSWLPPKESIPFNRIYVTDLVTTLRDGRQIQHKAGELICDQNGNPRLYNEVVVFCQYYIDPDFPGQPQYLRGNNPTEKGQAYFGSFCVAANAAPAVNPTPSISEEEAGAVAPEAPIVPPGMKLQGYDSNMQPIYVPA
jgi:hypothetical protein